MTSEETNNYSCVSANEIGSNGVKIDQAIAGVHGDVIKTQVILYEILS